MGAWWLGFLVTGVVILMSAIPFFFLPKSMAKQGEEEEEEEKAKERGRRTGPGPHGSNMEHESFLPGEKAGAEKEEEKEVDFSELAKGRPLSVHSDEAHWVVERLAKNQHEPNGTDVV